VSVVTLHAKLHGCRNEGLGPTGVKIAKIANFWYNFAKKGIPPYAIFTKFGLERESQVRTLLPDLTVVALKMSA